MFLFRWGGVVWRLPNMLPSTDVPFTGSAGQGEAQKKRKEKQTNRATMKTSKSQRFLGNPVLELRGHKPFWVVPVTYKPWVHPNSPVQPSQKWGGAGTKHLGRLIASPHLHCKHTTGWEQAPRVTRHNEMPEEGGGEDRVSRPHAL